MLLRNGCAAITKTRVHPQVGMELGKTSGQASHFWQTDKKLKSSPPGNYFITVTEPSLKQRV